MNGGSRNFRVSWSHLGLLTALMLAAGPGTQAADEELIFAEIPQVYAAARREQPLGQAPAAVTLITRDDIRRYGYRTLGQALASVPGFFLTNDRGYEYIGVRGLGIPTDYNIRLLFLLNGLPLNDKYYGTFVPELAPDMFDAIERIEVIKGPSSALYGSDALFAVVNIITRSGAAAAGHATVSGEVGSHPSGRGVFSYGKLFDNGWDVFLSGHYEADHGEQRIGFGRFGDAHGADDARLGNAYLSARHGDWALQFWYGDRQKEIPTGQFGTILGDERTETADRWYLADARWQRAVADDKTLSLRAYFQDYAYEATYVYDDPTYHFNNEQTLDRWLGYETQFDWRPLQWSRLTAGAVVEYHWTRLTGNYRDTAGAISSVYTGTHDDFPYWAAYLQNEFRLQPSLTLTLGGRYDDYPDFDVARFSPRAALVWAITGQTTVKLLYGQAFRAPSNYERTYPFGADLGPPNPGLDPELITTYELVLEQDFRHGLSGRLSVFHNDVDRLIAPVSDTPDPEIFGNVFDVETTGIEAELAQTFTNGIRGFANATWQNSRPDNGRLLNSPVWLANFGASFPLFDHKLNLALRQNYVSARATRVPGQETDDSFHTDLTLGAENLLPHWSFHFIVQNVFNQRAQVPAGDDGTVDTLPQPGRVFYLRASYRF